MATEFMIITLETVSKTTHLYLVVEFYIDNTLTHTEDFIIGRPAEKRIYTGAIGPDDEILDPEAYTIESLDIKQEIIDVIHGFERVHRGDALLTGKPTNRTSSHVIKTDQTDPHGWLNRNEVKDLKDKKVLI